MEPTAFDGDFGQRCTRDIAPQQFAGNAVGLVFVLARQRKKAWVAMTPDSSSSGG